MALMWNLFVNYKGKQNATICISSVSIYSIANNSYIAIGNE